jgi:hypothetical protein
MGPLPFSEAAFLDVFGAYNEAWWPAVVSLWMATAAVALRGWRRRVAGRSVLILLAVHWAWSGIAYHAMFFSRINPAAMLFAGVFVLQAGVFAWRAASSPATFMIDRSPRGLVAGALVAYGLAYPLLGLLFGLHYPRLPLFAVPCPTTIVTTGWLIAAAGVPRWVAAVPALWAFTGGSAAFVLGIRADFVLLICGGLLVVDMVAPRNSSRRQ